MAQQTAVEWLVDSMAKNNASDKPTIERIHKHADIVREAIQMEKERREELESRIIELENMLLELGERQ